MPAMARLLLMVLLLPSACSAPDQLEHYRLAAFGTDITVTIRRGPIPESDAEAVVADIGRDFRRLHRRWHAWEPGMLTRINDALAAGRTIRLDAEALSVVRRAGELERLSGGTFNPAIGSLLSLWGFHASERPEGPPPDAARIDRLVQAAPSMGDLRFEGRQVSSVNPAVQLDFGAYLKGVAVERALHRLEAAGFAHAIVNAGGDLGVIGRRGDRFWQAAVEHPDGSGERLLAGLSVHPGEFVFTSGNYHRYRSNEGLRYGHILDPRDGYPADRVQSVTVITQDGGLADAAATALAVAGEDEWEALAARLGVEHVLRVDGQGSVTATAAMVERLEWRGAPGPVRTVSLPR